LKVQRRANQYERRDHDLGQSLPDIDRRDLVRGLSSSFRTDELLALISAILPSRPAGGSQMQVTFWAPGRFQRRAGTTLAGGPICVEVRCGIEIIIFDAGTGIRPLGLALMKEFPDRPLTIHLFISHTHWDHIQGFPYFMPAYLPATTIHIYGSQGQGRPLERILRGQMDTDYFPVALGDMKSILHVHEFGVSVSNRRGHRCGHVSKPSRHDPRLPPYPRG
jgi:hypothetical protein